MTLAAVTIMLFEILAISNLFEKVTGDRNCEIEEFVLRANLEDIYQLRFHQNNGFLALGIATMGRLFNF